jgi:hypothetical protein
MGRLHRGWGEFASIAQPGSRRRGQAPPVLDAHDDHRVLSVLGDHLGAVGLGALGQPVETLLRRLQLPTPFQDRIDPPDWTDSSCTRRTRDRPGHEEGVKRFAELQATGSAWLRARAGQTAAAPCAVAGAWHGEPEKVAAVVIADARVPHSAVTLALASSREPASPGPHWSLLPTPGYAAPDSSLPE